MQSNKELWGSSFKSAPRLGYFIWKGSLSASPILFGITVMPLEAVMSCEFPGKHVMGGRSMYVQSSGLALDLALGLFQEGEGHYF